MKILLSESEFKNKKATGEIKNDIYLYRHGEDLTIHVYKADIKINNEYTNETIYVEWI